jgi:hypothetical protein
MGVLALRLPLDVSAHVIQVALTPVFLLSAIGVLLNLFNTRLADVSNHIAHTTECWRRALREMTRPGCA